MVRTHWSTRRVVGVAFSISIAFNFVGLWQVARLSHDQTAAAKRLAAVRSEQVVTAADSAKRVAEAQAVAIAKIERESVHECLKRNDLRDGIVRFVDDAVKRAEVSTLAMINSPSLSPTVVTAAKKNLASLEITSRAIHADLPAERCSLFRTSRPQIKETDGVR